MNPRERTPARDAERRYRIEAHGQQTSDKLAQVVYTIEFIVTIDRAIGRVEAKTIVCLNVSPPRTYHSVFARTRRSRLGTVPLLESLLCPEPA